MKSRLLVGIYKIGNDQCRLFLREGKGADFWFNPTKGSVVRGNIAQICVGADVEGWADILSGLFHEVMEFAMTKNNVRYQPDQDFSFDHSAYLFSMNHTTFSDCCARSAMFLSEAIPDLRVAWKEWKKPAVRATKKKGKK